MPTPTKLERKHPLALCELCELKDKPCALTTGPANAKIAVVSRSPGYNEALAGKAFTGPSGKVLNHLLELQGVSRDDVLATNVVLCQTDEVSENAASCCSARLESDVQRAETVIAAGSEAARALLGAAASVSSDRGYPHIRQLPDGSRQRVIVK